MMMNFKHEKLVLEITDAVALNHTRLTDEVTVYLTVKHLLRRIDCLFYLDRQLFEGEFLVDAQFGVQSVVAVSCYGADVEMQRVGFVPSRFIDMLERMIGYLLLTAAQGYQRQQDDKDKRFIPHGFRCGPPDSCLLTPVSPYSFSSFSSWPCRSG